MARVVISKPRRKITLRSGLGQGLTMRGGTGLRNFFERPPLTPEQQFLRELELDGKVVYDIGAHEGVHTMFFASRVGPKGYVVTFEPHPRNHERTVENVGLNGFENVKVLRLAIGAEQGTLTLAFPKSDTGRTSADPAIVSGLDEFGEVEHVDVPVSTLDAAIAEHDLRKPDLVKIDVEGLEREVLAGMKATLTSAHPAIFVELHGQGVEHKLENAHVVAELLLAAGYTLLHVESGRTIGSPDQAPRKGHLYAI